MKHTHSFLTTSLILLTTVIFSQATNALWSPVKESSIRLTGLRQIVPVKYLTFSLNGEGLKNTLFAAPQEKNTHVEQSSSIISLPLPNGKTERFKVIESPIMAPELCITFPGIKTFIVKGIDDPHASGRVDWNDFGFHGMILSPRGDFFIDPYAVGNTTDYITYYTADFVKPSEHRILEENVLGLEEGQIKPGVPFKEEKNGAKTSSSPPAICVGANLRTYRLAVACTGEYAKASTGSTGTVIPTLSQVLSKINTSVNRVDGVYEREVAVRMVLVATETLIIFTNPSTDPFNGNNNANTLLNESQTVITATVGNSNYDIGHTFSTGAGGVAQLGCVCSTGNKARGVTGSSSPVGDPYDIDYVAHEMGHQFRGNHTFNSETGSCNGNRNSSTSVEPGSGVTIMAYAGICPGNNVTNNSIAYFHAISYDEIVNFTNSGSGNSCAVTTTTGNHPPVVTVSGNYIIPISTPFVMTGSATDPDGDKVYYSWEEIDAGAIGTNWNAGTKPYFRSYAPDSIAPTATSYSRFFPKKTVVASGNYTSTIGEYLPATAQTLNFRLTARDKKMGGGGVCYANTSIVVDQTGPLTVTYPSASGIVWFINTFTTVTWDQNGTDQAPVSCDTVSLWISFNSGTTYSLITNSTPNDGLETIAVPNVAATINTCRIKVESKGNIFYDISNNNFAISTSTTINLVGIQQVSQNNPVALSVWPNPSSGQLNFTAGNLNSKNPTLVNVVDMLGKTVLHYSYSNKSELKETLDLSELSNGVYFIKVSNATNQSVHRIVKD